MASSSTNESASQSSGYNQSQGASQSSSQSFIPNYSQTPILESIAKYAESMAPQIYQWGMDVYGKNQGNIDELMRTAETYASGQRLAVDMGAAEAGVMQAGEHALENSKQDLASYGIDPSSGRYAALDKAAKVQTAAAAAGAGNMQRQADIAMSNTMKNQAISASMQNASIGFQGANAANQFLSTGIRLPYSPLGTQSQASSYNQSQGANQSTSFSTGQSSSSDPAGGGGGGGGSKGGGGGKNPGGGPGQNSGKPEQPKVYGGGGGGGAGGGGGGFGPGSGGGDPLDNTGGTQDPWYQGGDPVYDPGGIYDTGGEGNPYPVYDPGEPGLPGSGGQDPGYWGEGWSDPGWNGDWGPTPDTGGEVNDWGYEQGGPVQHFYQGGVFLPSGGHYRQQIGHQGYHAMAEGGPAEDEEALPTEEPRFVSPDLSPSGGQEVDDVPARLQAGEFVMPDDVVRWKGEEFFQNLIEKSRVAREGVMQAHGQMQGQQSMNLGGAI